MDIHELVARQRQALEAERAEHIRQGGQSWQAQHVRRTEKLLRFRELLREREDSLLAALRADLGKSAAEGYMTELGFALSELSFTIKHLKRWMRPRHRHSPFAVFPARSRILAEPYGLVLIMSPWNYPLQLSLTPLISAIAAGNRCMLKPSNLSPHTSEALHELVGAWLPPEEAAVVLGGREENQQLLDQRFDYIFFTGGSTVGRIVMQKAAQHLTPITLELGGKSPCIVDDTADIPLAARRIAFGKALNAGQTCVAPDYLLVHESVKPQLVQAIEQEFRRFFGGDPLKSDSWPRIISQKHYDRLMTLLQESGVQARGDGQRIAPCLVETSWDAPLMREEIFGPILPVISYQDLAQVLETVASLEKPLAFYLFSRDQTRIRMVLQHLPFGGGCINDTVMHLTNPHLPFGGVGASGMGSYHGRKGFETFSHEKSVLLRGRLDPPFRYPPYNEKKLSLLKHFLK